MKEHKIRRRCLLPAALCLLLAGCAQQSDDNLYRLPELPREFKNLTSEINEVLSQGAEYCAPLGGENIQNIQLQDMDGDGVVDSAIAFFRMTGEESQPKIYIYRQMGETYELEAVIEGPGTGINYIDYVNLDDSPDKEVVVSWQLSDQLHFLSAYSVSSEQVVELLRTDYTAFKLYDMDRDDNEELLILNTKPEGGSEVELYDFRDGLMEPDSAAPLSKNIGAVQDEGMRKGYLWDAVPALFVTSELSNGINETSSGQVTDILVWEQKEPNARKQLRNITLQPESNTSEGTLNIYAALKPTDINQDGILELATSAAVEEYRPSGSAPNFWLNRWSQYDISGTPYYVCTTYYNKQDGWYLILPDEWEGKITLSRSDAAGGGERAVIFSYWDKESGAEPIPFLTIYRLSGSNRVSRGSLPGRFRLGDSGEDNPTVIYAAELMDGWDCGLDEAGVREHFRIIQTDWDSFD